MRSLRARVPAFLLAALCASVALHATPAAAQPPSAPASKGAGGDPVRLFEEGVAAAKAEDWPKARAAFLRAWELKQHWQIAANLGRAELMLKRYCNAVEHLTYVLKEAKELSATDRQQMQEMLDKALAKVGSLTVRVDVDGADVFVDERPVGKSPLGKDVCVEAGTRTVEARQEGSESARESVDLKAGSTMTVELLLNSRRPSQALRSLEEGRAKGVGAEPSAPGGGGARNVVLGMGIAVTAATTILGLASVGYAVVSQGERDKEISNLPESGTPTRENSVREIWVNDGESIAAMNVGVASLIVGGACGVATLVYWVTSPKKTPPVDLALSFGKSSKQVSFTYVW
jgi:hypothetical protein